MDINEVRRKIEDQKIIIKNKIHWDKFPFRKGDYAEHLTIENSNVDIVGDNSISLKLEKSIMSQIILSYLYFSDYNSWYNETLENSIETLQQYEKYIRKNNL